MGLFSLSAQVTEIGTVKQPQWRFSASGGLGYKTAKGNSSDNTVVNKEKVTQFNNSLRWTPTINTDVHYLRLIAEMRILVINTIGLILTAKQKVFGGYSTIHMIFIIDHPK